VVFGSWSWRLLLVDNRRRDARHFRSCVSVTGDAARVAHEDTVVTVRAR